MKWFARIVRLLGGGAKAAVDTARTGAIGGPVSSGIRHSTVDAASRIPAYAVVDVETTGLSPHAHRVIELAIIRLNSDAVAIDEWVCRFDPEGSIGATHVHGITAEDVLGAPRFIDRAQTIATLLEGLAVVGHNVRFDLAFLQEEMARSQVRLPIDGTICTIEISADRFPGLQRRRLADCCAAAGVALSDAHSALGDARATASLLKVFLNDGPLARFVQPPVRRTGSGRRTALLPPAQQAHVARQIAKHAQQQRTAPLTRLVSSMHLADVADEGPADCLAYLEVLAEVLEDGVITEAERATLSEVAELYSLDEHDLAAAHGGFLRALARIALLDLRVTRDERAELVRVAQVLAVDTAEIERLLGEEEVSRWRALSARLSPLPPDWTHGEPLRVGDKIAFTGCDEVLRERLEARAIERGVRVINSVSARTALLVSDGSFDGTKAEAARRLGTRVVQPAQLSMLLEHLQPFAASLTPSRATPRSPGIARPTPAPGDENAAAIRAWASRAGLQVGVRGRIPAAVVAAYRAAHSEVPI